MSREMTNSEAISNLNQIYGFVSSEIQQSLDLAIKALKRVDCIYLKDECSFACGECGYCEAEKLGATCLAKRNENGQLEAIISLDNAPTVDLWEVRQEATENALKKAEVLYGRPHGEWQYTTHHARRYRICPFCKCEKEDDRSAGWFYCWHCGADMRGKEE